MRSPAAGDGKSFALALAGSHDAEHRPQPGRIGIGHPCEIEHHRSLGPSPRDLLKFEQRLQRQGAFEPEDPYLLGRLLDLNVQEFFHRSEDSAEARSIWVTIQ